MVSSKTYGQNEKDYRIAPKMKHEEIEEQNEAAIRPAKEKREMEFGELEENNSKRLAENCCTPFLMYSIGNIWKC